MSPQQREKIQPDSTIGREIFMSALKIRIFEEKLLELFGAGLIRGTVHTCLGQELLPVVASRLLDTGDTLFGTHRGHGFFLAMTGEYERLAREILGREGGVTRGVGGTQHLVAKGFLTNGIQGGLVPVAAGFSSSLSAGSVSVAVIGDGSLGQGVVYETLNIASLQNLPLVLIIEDNGISQSTPTSQNLAGSIAERVTAFGIKFFETEDTDLETLFAELEAAIVFSRQTGSPAAVRVSTRRLGPHSKGDDNRAESHMKTLWDEDPVSLWLHSSAQNQALHAQLTEEIDGLFRSVLEEPHANEIPVDRLEASLFDGLRTDDFGSPAPTIRQCVSEAIQFAMSSSSDTLMVGEDIEPLPPGMSKPYSGAFGVSGGLAKEFHERLRNFPISEQALVGFGIGRSLAGSVTLVEIMFGDFATLIIDQLRQQASKIAGIYGNAPPLPLLIRMPMGGRRGYGPTHSQSLEGMLLGIPNTVCYSVSPFGFAKELFFDLMQAGLPVLVFENKDLYAVSPSSVAPEPYEIERPGNLSEPIYVFHNQHRVVGTIVSYGYAAKITMEALSILARDHELFFDLFVLELLQPISAKTIVESLAQTGTLIVVEEGQVSEGITSSLLSSAEISGNFSQFRFMGIGANGDIGASAFSENWALLSVERVVSEIKRFVGHQ